MRRYGLTRARSMGPVAEIVERSGGSVARVFQHAELPLRLIEEPDRLILLKDQLNVVECAARELGDEALAPRLSLEAGFAGLGAYGGRVSVMPRLDSAIVCANETIEAMLQSSTKLSLTRLGRFSTWTYRVTDPVVIGRQRNELLAIGYMLDLLRRFAGPNWTPLRIELPGPPLPRKAAVEGLLHCEISRGEAAAITFPTDLFQLRNPGSSQRHVADGMRLPDPTDIVACAEQLIALALLESRPGIDWLCRRMEMSRRSLQRHLRSRDTSFMIVLHGLLRSRATELLRAGASATDIAFELGYGDPAHFTRAFRHWTGQSPRAWRRA